MLAIGAEYDSGIDRSIEGVTPVGAKFCLQDGGFAVVVPCENQGKRAGPTIVALRLDLVAGPLIDRVSYGTKIGMPRFSFKGGGGLAVDVQTIERGSPLDFRGMVA